MKKPLNTIRSGLKKMKASQVKLRLSTCGEIMIDGLNFAFGVESAGTASDKGLCVSISGEAVDSGEVTFSDLEYHEQHGGSITVVKHDFPVVTKKDGKRIYQARFTRIPITEYSSGAFFRKVTEQDVINRINAQISFRVTPHYSGSNTPEVMLSIYPYDNPLTGSATQWLKVTSDKDYFLNKSKHKQGRT